MIFLSLIETEFNCPKCQCLHEEQDYMNRLSKSKGMIYKSCKGCKNKIGITTDIKGNVKVWLKEDESKYRKNSFLK